MRHGWRRDERGWLRDCAGWWVVLGDVGLDFLVECVVFVVVFRVGGWVADGFEWVRDVVADSVVLDGARDCSPWLLLFGFERWPAELV